MSKYKMPFNYIYAYFSFFFLILGNNYKLCWMMKVPRLGNDHEFINTAMMPFVKRKTKS